MLSRIIVLYLLFFSVFAHAEECVIHGFAKGYESRRIAVVALEDELSGKRILLAQTDVGEQGEFLLRFDPIVTRRIFLHIQRIEAPMYAESGKSYEVVFPQVGKEDFKRFDNTEVELQFVNLQNDDVNLKIRKFNGDYAKFIRDHFYDFASDEYRGSETYMRYLGDRKNSVDLYAKQSKQDSLSKDLVKNFRRVLELFEDSVSGVHRVAEQDVFTKNYIRYSMAELKLLSGMNRVAFYEDYFMSLPPQEFNPAYISCFKLFSRNLLTGQKASIQSAIMKSVNIDRDLNRLNEALSESVIISDRLRKMAALNGLKENYNNKAFDKTSIEILLSKVKTGDTLIDHMAKAMLFQLTRCREGWYMEDVVFTDESQEKWLLSDSDGLPMYVLFFATWSPSSLKELKVMERLQEQYKGRINFVGVCMDDDYRNYRKFLEENMKLSIKLVYGNAEAFVSEKFNLKSIPHQVMLEVDLRVVSDVCPAPSDPIIEAFLNRSLPEQTPRQGQKTWRDN